VWGVLIRFVDGETGRASENFTRRETRYSKRGEEVYRKETASLKITQGEFRAVGPFHREVGGIVVSVRKKEQKVGVKEDCGYGRGLLR